MHSGSSLNFCHFQIQTGDSEPVLVIEEKVVNESCDNIDTAAHTVKGKTKTFTVSTPADQDIQSNLLVRVRNQSVQTNCTKEPRSLRRQSEPAKPLAAGEMFDAVEKIQMSRIPDTNFAAGDTLPHAEAGSPHPGDPDLTRCVDDNSDKSSDTGIGYSVDDRASPESGETTCL